MTETVARMLFPFALTIGAALWAKSYTGVGDGFSAGAVAGLGAVAQYVALAHARARRIAGARFATAFVGVGLLLVLVLLLAPVFAGIAPVMHVPRPGAHVSKIGHLEMHTALVQDLGIALVVYGVMVLTFDRVFPVRKEDPS